MEPELEGSLDRVVSGPLFTADELPQPTADECKASDAQSDAGGLFERMGVKDESNDEEDDGVNPNPV